jgi:hypothetical protein
MRLSTFSALRRDREQEESWKSHAQHLPQRSKHEIFCYLYVVVIVKEMAKN